MPRSLRSSSIASRRYTKSGGTTAFSVLVVVIIFIVGILLMLLSIFLDLLTSYFRSKLQKDEYKQVQWGLDGIFHLHRLAYEAAGHGTWTGGFQFYLRHKERRPHPRTRLLRRFETSNTPHARTPGSLCTALGPNHHCPVFRTEPGQLRGQEGALSLPFPSIVL